MCLCALPLGGKLAGLPCPGRRDLSLSAAVNGLASAMCLSPVPLLALAGLPGSVALCFRQHGFPACLRCMLTTLFASFLLGGAMTALINAGLSPAAAAAVSMGMSLAAYLLITLLPGAMCDVRQVEIRVEDRAILLPAMLDSGNLLRDPVTGLGVLVIPRKAVRTLFPDAKNLSDLTLLPLGFRLLNVRTAAGSALLPMFRPDLCRIYLNGKSCDARLLVAVAGCDYSGAQALVPMSALPKEALSS
ncbi:MAG: sigma-E processing peptidase SpoIIGA [Clostridia bacterium]|nr:sigma-E processing peptidase SpoIIGA [Clostridia bacterium]